MKSDIDEVALQGIEFWSNVCDEEMDLAIEASEVSSPSPRKSAGCQDRLFGNAAPASLNWKSSRSPERNSTGEPI